MLPKLLAKSFRIENVRKRDGRLLATVQAQHCDRAGMATGSFASVRARRRTLDPENCNAENSATGAERDITGSGKNKLPERNANKTDGRTGGGNKRHPPNRGQRAMGAAAWARAKNAEISTGRSAPVARQRFYRAYATCETISAGFNGLQNRRVDVETLLVRPRFAIIAREPDDN